MGKASLESSNHAQANDVGVSPQEDRGGSAGKVGEVEGEQEGCLVRDVGIDRYLPVHQQPFRDVTAVLVPLTP